jgi:hypothetical protein
VKSVIVQSAANDVPTNSARLKGDHNSLSDSLLRSGRFSTDYASANTRL